MIYSLLFHTLFYIILEISCIIYNAYIIRSIRIEGRVCGLDSTESDIYFKSRPRNSQVYIIYVYNLKYKYIYYFLQ